MLLLVLLLIFGKRVSYEQSIKLVLRRRRPGHGRLPEGGDGRSATTTSSSSSTTTPSCSPPPGWTGSAELAAAVGPGPDPGRAPGRVARRDAAALDDRRRAARRSTGCRRSRRNLALSAAQADDQEPRPEDERDDRRRRGPARPTPTALADAQGPADAAPALPRHGDRRAGHDDGRRGPAEEDATSTTSIDDGRAPCGPRPTASRRGTSCGRPAVVGPPVLLADGFTSIEIDGRRLAVVGHAPDRPGHALGRAQPLVGDRADRWPAGWSGWRPRRSWRRFNLKLSLSGGPLVAQIIVLTMPAASHLAIHFRDDRRREADPRVAARSTLRAVVGADPLVRRSPARSATGRWSPATSCPIQQFGAILGICTLVAAAARDGDLADRHAPAVPRWRSPSATAPTRGSPAAMNRLTAWVFRHPARDRRRRLRRGPAARAGDVPAPVRVELHQRLQARDPGRPRLPRRRVAARRDRPGRAGRAGRARRSTPATARRAAASSSRRSPAIRVHDRAADRARALAGHGARPRRPARGACPTTRPARILADKLDLIAALAAGRAARAASGTPRPARPGVLVRLLGAAAGARQGGDLPRGRRRPRARRSARRRT